MTEPITSAAAPDAKAAEAEAQRAQAESDRVRQETLMRSPLQRIIAIQAAKKIAAAKK